MRDDKWIPNPLVIHPSDLPEGTKERAAAISELSKFIDDNELRICERMFGILPCSDGDDGGDAFIEAASKPENWKKVRLECAALLQIVSRVMRKAEIARHAIEICENGEDGLTYKQIRYANFEALYEQVEADHAYDEAMEAAGETVPVSTR